MSALYKTVKKFYDMGIYKNTHVRVFVEKGKLTAKEYELITGEIYE